MAKEVADALWPSEVARKGFDQDDLVGALHDIREEIRKLPQLHNQLWDLFKTIRNKKDMEQFEQLLADEAKRQDFYARLRAFGRCLHIALSSEKLYDVFDEDKIEFLQTGMETVQRAETVGTTPLPGSHRSQGI